MPFRSPTLTLSLPSLKVFFLSELSSPFCILFLYVAMESESKMLDNVELEKEKAIARFNCIRSVMRLRQLLELSAAVAAVSWCSARLPAVIGAIRASFEVFSRCASNHHVVFLIGNAIIVFLFMLCRHSDAFAAAGGFGDEYVKRIEAARGALPLAPASRFVTGGVHDIETAAVRGEETAAASSECDDVADAVAKAEISKCDDVADAIAEAARRIRRFERTQSEALRRKFRRSVTESYRKAAEMENLSSEEFRRRVDDFIDQHWSRRHRKRK